jgi:hypothetical protein
MKSQLTIRIDATLKERLVVSAKARKQSVSDFVSGVLRHTVQSDERKHVTVSPYIMEMTSDLQLPADDIDEKDAFIAAMEAKH